MLVVSRSFSFESLLAAFSIEEEGDEGTASFEEDDDDEEGGLRTSRSDSLSGFTLEEEDFSLVDLSLLSFSRRSLLGPSSFTACSFFSLFERVEVSSLVLREDLCSILGEEEEAVVDDDDDDVGGYRVLVS